MTNKPTSITEALVMFLAENRGVWIPVYALVQKELYGKWTGISADRRLREIGKEGRYERGEKVFFIERKMEGKYAYYRVTQIQSNEFTEKAKNQSVPVFKQKQLQY